MANFDNFKTEHPRYFPGQYLLADDFELQHKYLAGHQRYQNKSLHVSGIIEGLDVVDNDGKSVNIKSGSAIDSNGDLIILKNTEEGFDKFNGLTEGDLFIEYISKSGVPQQTTEDTHTRFLEKPIIKFAATTSDKGVKLAKLTIAGGKIKIDPNIRQYSGLSLPNSGNKALTLRSGGNANPNLAVLTGSLKIEENLTVEGTGKSEFAGSLIVNGAVQLGGFTEEDEDEWSKFTWYRDISKSWDEGLIKHKSSRGVFKRAGYGIHFHESREFGFWSSGFDPLFAVEGKTGNTDIKGNLKVNGTISGQIDAANITSGQLAAARIPNLNADKITSGTINGNISIVGDMRINEAGRQNFSGFHNELRRSQQILSSQYSDLIIASSQINNNHGSTLTLATYNPDDPDNYRKWVINQGNWGDRKHMLEIGYKDDAEKNPHGYINNSATVMTLNGITKCIGIGTRNPTKGKVEIEGSRSYKHPNGYRYFKRTTAKLEETGGFNAPYSLYATGFIGAQEFNAVSDMRIKEVKGVSDSKSDLKVLLQIGIVDYAYKDKIANDSKPHKKVIGQHVAEVFPQAVRTHTDVVPDIFQPASIANGWVKLDAHRLQVGERVQLVLEDSEPKIYTIEAVNPESFQVSLDYEGDVFVYGREVNDFHVVDYDALAMLHISATQELCKIIDALKIEVRQLKAQLNGNHHPIAAIPSS